MTPHFSTAELACRCGCGLLPKPESAARLERLREICDFPFKVNRGASCPAHNAKVSSTGTDGPHTTGQAFDLGVSGERALRLVDRAREVGFTGIGVKQHGPHERRFVHVDDLPNADGQPRPWIWSYP